MNIPFKNKSELTLRLEKLSIYGSRWIGSSASLVFHTILFLMCFLLIVFGFDSDKIMLALTTIVSLEAIYLSIFIQMSVNRQSRKLREVSRDIEEIGEDVEGLTEDVEEIQKDVEEIQEDVEEIQEDVEGIQEDVEEISEDVEEINEEDENEENDPQLEQIKNTLELLMQEISQLRKNNSKSKIDTKIQKPKIIK